MDNQWFDLSDTLPPTGIHVEVICVFEKAAVVDGGSIGYPAVVFHDDGGEFYLKGTAVNISNKVKRWRYWEPTVTGLPN